MRAGAPTRHAASSTPGITAMSAGFISHTKITGRVYQTTRLAPGIVGLELRPTDGGTFPPFTAGAHIDLTLPNGLTRPYSLVNAQDETHRYEIAVKREELGRGGSTFVHDSVQPGDVLKLSLPRNNFRLDEGASFSVLVCGGIGVTPIASMTQRLAALGRSWHVHYAAHSRSDAIFLHRLAELAKRASGTLDLWFDDEHGGAPLDIRARLAAAPPDAHFYCCGPGPMIAAFDAALAAVPPAHVHREHFSATTQVERQGAFCVVLAKSGRTLTVSEDETILDVLLDNGVHVDFSCMEGFCGSCRVRVLEGTPVHRDTTLSPAERAASDVMAVCCSRTNGSRLVLDL